MKPGRLNMTLYQGSTFRQTLRWAQPTPVAAQISTLTGSLPVQITTAAPHNLPAGEWPVIINSRCGRLPSTPVMATNTGASTLTVPLSTVGLPPWRGPGEIVYNPPVDMTGWTGRLQARASIGDANPPLLDLTTANGGVVVNPLGLVEVIIPAADTAAVVWTTAVYDLEVESPAGDVYRLVEGELKVSPEVTR